MSHPPLLAHPGQSLAVHLAEVAELAALFAANFDASDHACLAGWLHDLGKAEAEFQKRINTDNKQGEKQPHAHHGAALALAHQLWPVAFAINGHHAGLHNRSALQGVPTRYEAKAIACENALRSDPDATGFSPPDLASLKTLPPWLDQLPATTGNERLGKMRAVDFYTRMLFSALVDADRLDTERVNSSDGSQANIAKRKTWRFGESALATPGAATSLSASLAAAIEQRATAARAKGASHAVLDVRASVLTACHVAATSPRGVFSLTVPTGGGKTLASLAFALKHIEHHNANLAPGALPLRRIVIVIPYLNIIQQTTKELVDVFGHTDADPLVLEHHSQASDPEIKDAKKDADGWDRERSLRQLATENWDAPIIVTTSVQFFDSLFSRRPTDARKLHNLCQSVVIFDEVQSLPPLLLQPILDALTELSSPQRPYACSLVLCTATQPALKQSEDLPFGFAQLTEINPAADNHFKQLERVTYQGLSKGTAPSALTNDALAAAMLASPRQQALAILNTRKQARSLFDTLRAKAGTDTKLASAIFHLSTWMYPAHRKQVLREVERRLAANEPCLLVSTQCIEAGVDVDFPAVWRAFGPYDSIVQAAGRCNRHGSRARSDSIVTVFTPADDSSKPGGVYGSAMQNAELLRKMGKADPHDPTSFDTYFRLLYQTTVPDPGGCAIQSAREQLHFEAVSDLFNFIEADTVPLLIEISRVAGADSDSETRLPDGRTVRELRESAKPRAYFTPDEWRMIQPLIVNLSHPTSRKVKEFLHDSDSELVFKGDDPDRGLRWLKTGLRYHDGLHGAGLVLTPEAMNALDSIL